MPSVAISGRVPATRGGGGRPGHRLVRLLAVLKAVSCVDWDEWGVKMDEEADLALLDQHLLKTNLLSQRMTSILGQLDTRLSRLDKTIVPLGLQPLTRKATNIDTVLAHLNHPGPSRTPRSDTSTHSRSQSSAQHSQSQAQAKGYSLGPSLTPIPSTPTSGAATPADETAILTRGPDVMSLGEFFSSLDAVVGDLERMWKGFKEGRGGAREAGVRDLSKLVEIGFGGIVQLFLKIARDGMGRTFDIDHLMSSGPPTPPNYFPPLNTLLPLTMYMNFLIFPKPPAPKTQSVVQPLFGELIAAFADLRGEWMRKSLGVLMSRVEELDEGGIWEGGRGQEKVRGLIGLWDAMIVLVEAETLLITTLFPSHPPSILLPLTLSHPLSALSTAFTPTINTIRRSVSTHSFLAIDLYQSLSRVSQQWEAAISKCFSMTRTPSSDTRDILSANASTISALRGLAMRSFPELLVDIRMAGQGPGQERGGPTSAISDTTYSTLTYLETLPGYEKTVEALLNSSQSQRSWLMGAKETPSPVRSAQEEGGVVNLFVADVLGTLIIHLNQRALSMRRPVGQTFLLNNLSHVRNTTSSFNSDIIGPGAEDMLNKAFRDAKAQYLAEWTSLTSLLTPSGSSGRFVPGMNERQQLKDCATSFFDRLVELEAACTQWSLSRQDPDLRDRLGKDVGELVGGAYGAFWGRCQGKGVEKYLRGTPDEVRKRVQTIFR